MKRRELSFRRTPKAVEEKITVDDSGSLKPRGYKEWSKTEDAPKTPDELVRMGFPERTASKFSEDAVLQKTLDALSKRIAQNAEVENLVGLVDSVMKLTQNKESIGVLTDEGIAILLEGLTLGYAHDVSRAKTTNKTADSLVAEQEVLDILGTDVESFWEASDDDGILDGL